MKVLAAQTGENHQGAGDLGLIPGREDPLGRGKRLPTLILSKSNEMTWGTSFIVFNKYEKGEVNIRKNWLYRFDPAPACGVLSGGSLACTERDSETVVSKSENQRLCINAHMILESGFDDLICKQE